MNTYRLLLIAVFLTAIAGFSIQAQTLYNGVGHIPTYYQERWNRAGLLRDMSAHEPKLIINFENLSGNDDQKMVTALNNARNHVQSTDGLAIIFFPPGTYALTMTVPTVLSDSDIVFQGAGSNRTILEFQNMKDSHCFDIGGYAGGWSNSRK